MRIWQQRKENKSAHTTKIWIHKKWEKKKRCVRESIERNVKFGDEIRNIWTREEGEEKKGTVSSLSLSDTHTRTETRLHHVPAAYFELYATHFWVSRAIHSRHFICVPTNIWLSLFRFTKIVYMPFPFHIVFRKKRNILCFHFAAAAACINADRGFSSHCEYQICFETSRHTVGMQTALGRRNVRVHHRWYWWNAPEATAKCLRTHIHATQCVFWTDPMQTEKMN